MPNMFLFCVYACAGTYIVKTDKKEIQKDKTRARDLERVSKAGAGEAFFIFELRLAKQVLINSTNAKNNPWNLFTLMVPKFQNVTKLVLVILLNHSCKSTTH